MKTWDYKTITDAAEEELRSLMEQSRNSPNKFDKEILRTWAYGVFLLWNKITAGWQQDGDIDRLSRLTNYK